MSEGPIVSNVLNFEDARRVVEEHASLIRSSEMESVGLLMASGRVLAAPILADRDLPPFPRSTRDGYAVRAAEAAGVPATLDLIGEIRAGESPSTMLSQIAAGQAAAIMTGAPVPFG